MYIDRPRPDAATLAVPLAMAAFFGAIALILAAFTLLFLPPLIWAATVPATGVALTAMAGSLWYARSRMQLVYRAGEGDLRISDGRRIAVVRLADIDLMLREVDGELRRVWGRDGPPGPQPLDHAGIASARRYDVRARDTVLVRAGGEWLRFSPTNVEAFVEAVVSG